MNEHNNPVHHLPDSQRASMEELRATREVLQDIATVYTTRPTRPQPKSLELCLGPEDAYGTTTVSVILVDANSLTHTWALGVNPPRDVARSIIHYLPNLTMEGQWSDKVRIRAYESGNINPDLEVML